MIWNGNFEQDFRDSAHLFIVQWQQDIVMEENEEGVRGRFYGFLFLATLVIILLSIVLFTYSQRGVNGLGDMACGLIVIGILQGAAILFNKIFKKQDN